MHRRRFLSSLATSGAAHFPVKSHGRKILTVNAIPLPPRVLSMFRQDGRRTFTRQSNSIPPVLSPDVPVDEEGVPGYRAETYFNANPGDLLNDKYRLVAKIGWGTSSTVWLAHDTLG